MKMETLLTVEPSVINELVASFAQHNDELADARFNENVPVRMIFAPESGFPASLHYMFFTRGVRQDFHWHPGGRHLLVFGDTELTVRYNTCSTDTNPYLEPITLTVSTGTMASIRFPARTWHEFSAQSDEGTAVIAFSFHDTDDIVSSSPTLMEELTTYWHGPRE